MNETIMNDKVIINNTSLKTDTNIQLPLDSGEQIVISGIAGRFPESDNIKCLQDNLFAKIDLLTDDERRWTHDDPEIPRRTGKISNINKFDALFFGVHSKQAQTMDPMCRMLLEHAYEAIVDAGINPRQLRGTKTGVFIGACYSESEKTLFYDKKLIDGFGMTGCSRALLANRISYWLGITGPSYAVDSACSSSLYAMDQAYKAIRSGQCDAALVGGANLCLHPCLSLQYARLGVLSPDGCCKTFDANANGYGRSEAVCIVFLQKAKHSKRIYANIVHSKINCDGYKPQGITHPSTNLQSALYKEFYDECKISPRDVFYIETHGTGTKVGDMVEVNAIDAVFCKEKRNTPLKIGTIKSNMGHAEPASGMCSIAKIVIANEAGIVPPNLHYQRPREGVRGLEEGRIQVVAEPTPWPGGYMGISSFGFGGANAHVLLKSHTKEKINGGAPKDDLPRLVVVSGRTEEAVETLLHDVENRPIDVEYIKLLHDIYADDIPGHLYRGYTVLKGTTVPEKCFRAIEHYPGAKRPIWFVFSGMGSQWPSMGTALLRFPIFAATIAKCDAVLKPHHVDIYYILTNSRESFDNILHAFVGIVAIQIGLADLLKALGITPDHIIGHSLGELSCAYADGCFTVEQAVMTAYYRGLVSIETETINGAMAAVALGYKDIKDICPADIQVACHNSAESSTISGPAESVKQFIDKLRAKKIFAREIPVGNIAYHSHYVAKPGSKLLELLKKIIPQPKPRSSKWLSTSIPQSQWSSAKARVSSAEYHTNNFLSPVLFEETCALIPNDAVTIEIAPYGLLQSILRKSLNGVTNIALCQVQHPDNVAVFLQAIGKLYDVGGQPKVSNLYPEVQLPVSRGTPMISPLVKWSHTEDWYVASFRQEKLKTGERTVEISLDNPDYKYMAGHIIDGRNVMPATGYLVLIWETLGMMQGKLFTELTVTFENLKFVRTTIIPATGSVVFTLTIRKDSGQFEIMEGDAEVATGIVNCTSESTPECTISDDFEGEMLTADVYKELRLRGYQYTGQFQAIKCTTLDGSRGKISWVNNWVTFMDNMLQMLPLGIDTRDLVVTTGIQKLVINGKSHLNKIQSLTGDAKELVVHRNKILDTIVAGGVEIRGVRVSTLTRRKKTENPVLESYEFVSYRDRAVTPFRDAVSLATQIALENWVGVDFKTVEVLGVGEKYIADDLISCFILDTIKSTPGVQADVNILGAENICEAENLSGIHSIEARELTVDKNIFLLAGRNILTKDKSLRVSELVTILKNGSFFLTIETAPMKELTTLATKYGLHIIFEKVVNEETFLLLRKQDLPGKSLIVAISNDSLEWIPEVQRILKSEVELKSEGNIRVLLVSDKFETGLMGVINCLRKEPGGDMMRGIVIQDAGAPQFSLTTPLYADQLKQDLAINVLRPGGTWGSYRNIKLPALQPRPTYHALGNQLVHGSLNSLRWLDGPIPPCSTHPDLINIVYSAVNFKDIMLAIGKIAPNIEESRIEKECILGFEYSGIDCQGRRVMGLLKSRGFSNKAVIDRHLSWYIPDSWSLEDAATVPSAYATAYYALYVEAHMKKGDKILIHTGAGGVGQAAITLALSEGCEVFTTVGSAAKREFIRKRFPQIQDNHIGNSRDTSFEQLIREQTGGVGVDIVLNALSEEKLQASFRCVANGGKFVEIGKFDIFNDSQLGMSVFDSNKSFHSVLLDTIYDAPDERKIKFKNMLQCMLDSGSIKPLSRTVFPRNQLEAAFQYMATGKNIGKVLIHVLDENNLHDAIITALPRYNCLTNRSYIIIGGLGGSGLELADWLVLRGARNLVLTSRSGYRNGYQRKRVKVWQSYGARVLVIAKDAATRSQCEEILKAASQLAPVDAIFNLAVILKDCFFENQTVELFQEVMKPKVSVTKALDEVSRELCPDLRHFVVFSSFSCGRGNAGQTNYSMGNSTMERICEQRVADGLPALAVEWGVIGDVGLIGDSENSDEKTPTGGTLAQSISSCLHVLDGFLNQSATIVVSAIIAESKTNDSAESLNIVDTILKIMNIKDLKSISIHTSLAELGTDSLMAVEIKQTLQWKFGKFVSTQDVRKLTFATLMEMDAKDVKQAAVTKVESNDDSDSWTGVERLHKFLGKAEDICSDICVALKTQREVGRNEVFFIPGIEGYAAVFSNLANHIKSPATCLQLENVKTDYQSVEEMADHILPHMLMRNKGRKNFVIAGYSYGNLIAIELMRRLEAQGLTGRLICIDGTPQLVRAIIDRRYPDMNNDALGTHILTHFPDILDPQMYTQLFTALQKTVHTWPEKINMYMAHVSPEVLPIFAGRNIFTGICHRVLAGRSYDETKYPRLQAPIVLLKASEQIISTIGGDLGLSAVTRGKVDVHVVEGTHTTIIDNAEVARFIDDE